MKARLCVDLDSLILPGTKKTQTTFEGLGTTSPSHCPLDGLT